MDTTKKCKHCGHIEDDHDGYAGGCDGPIAEASRSGDMELWNDLIDSRVICPCTDFEV